MVTAMTEPSGQVWVFGVVAQPARATAAPTTNAPPNIVVFIICFSLLLSVTSRD